MSFNDIRENKLFANSSEFTVHTCIKHIKMSSRFPTDFKDSNQPAQLQIQA